MKIMAIIQARMGSTRLPGKILKKVNDKTLLEYQLERVQASSLLDEIILATTRNKIDDFVAQFVYQLGFNVYRGSENDVLSRYYEAAVEFKADVIVRLTSDCPLIDPEVIDEVIRLYLSRDNDIDYASNGLERTFPRGLDVEVFSFEALQASHENALLERDREHVTSYIYTNQDQFRLVNYKSERNLSNHRWTVDTQEDFELISKILKKIYPFNRSFKSQDVLDLLEENPEWSEINAHIEQKKI